MAGDAPMLLIGAILICALGTMAVGAAICLIVFTILTCALGTMDGSSSGSYGTNCKLPYGRSCVGSKCRSHRMLGTFFCIDGCSDGWRGLACDRKCHRGCGSCNQFTGSCGKCLEGFCGQDCQDACITKGVGFLPSNCKTIMESGEVSTAGCQHGWRGERCDQKCPDACYSCPQYPDGRLCIYTKEDAKTRTFQFAFRDSKNMDTLNLKVIVGVIVVSFVLTSILIVAVPGVGYTNGKKQHDQAEERFL